MYNARPYILAETNWEVVRDTDYQLAILPWGATEAHNFHLPYATDNYQNEHIVSRCAATAWEKGAKVIVLPNVPFGVNTGQMDIKLCLNMSPSTQYAVLADIAEVVHRAGISKLLIFNGHGGNQFKTMIRELALPYPDMFVSAMNWYQVVKAWQNYFAHKGDHGGEMETSVMLHAFPELVRPLKEAGDGAAKSYRFQAMRDGWAYSQRPWSTVSKDTGVGNPYQATAKKGATYLEAVCSQVSQYFYELATTPNEEIFVD
ncbi:MAG: creatininase family protein [Bacteroidota bacterium]